MRGIFCGAVLGLFLFLLLMTPDAMAQDVPDTCDAEFHDVLRSKAWMEAQREIEVAETLMKERGSVLEYTCFKEIAEHFAEKTRFGNENDRETEYTYVGGPAPMTSVTPPSDDDSAMLTKHVDDILATAGLNCTLMKNMWKLSRCSNADKDKYFPKLDDLVAGDPRSCSGADSADDRDDDWEAADKIVFPDAFREVDKGGYDQMDGFFDKMDSSECSKSAIIKTGVTIDSSGDEEGICVAAGCYYNGNRCSS